MAISPDDKNAGFASADTTIKLWDAATGRCRSDVTGTYQLGYRRGVLSDGTLLASGGHDGTLRLWDLAAGAECKPPLA